MFRFVRLNEDHLEIVLNWRVMPEVSKYLFTDIEYSLEKQKRWYEKISSDESCRYWVIYHDVVPIGVINISELDFDNKRCNAGYYIGNLKYTQFGGLIPPYLYNYIFKNLKLRKIYGEVVDGNDIIKIHEMHGYKRIGTYTDHIYKDERFHDVHIIELLADEWLANKRYMSYVAEFED